MSEDFVEFVIQPGDVDVNRSNDGYATPIGDGCDFDRPGLKIHCDSRFEAGYTWASDTRQGVTRIQYPISRRRFPPKTSSRSSADKPSSFNVLMAMRVLSSRL